jgi:hypothetical protein
MFLPNVGIYPQVHTASPLGSPPPRASPPSEAQSHVTTHSDRANIILTPTQGLSAGRGRKATWPVSQVQGASNSKDV